MNGMMDGMFLSSLHSCHRAWCWCHSGKWCSWSLCSLAFINTLPDLFISRLGIILNVSFWNFMKHLEVLRVAFLFFSFFLSLLIERKRESASTHVSRVGGGAGKQRLRESQADSLLCMEPLQSSIPGP